MSHAGARAARRALRASAASLVAATCAASPRAPETRPPAVVHIAPTPAAPAAQGRAPIVPPAEEPPEEAPPLRWERDEPEARARARREGRPLLVYLRADWDAASLQMDRAVWPDPRVRAAARGFVALLVDLTSAEGDAELYAQRYGVRGLPTVVLIDAEGRRAAHIEGSQDAAALAAALRAARD